MVRFLEENVCYLTISCVVILWGSIDDNATSYTTYHRKEVLALLIHLRIASWVVKFADHSRIFRETRTPLPAATTIAQAHSSGILTSQKLVSPSSCANILIHHTCREATSTSLLRLSACLWRFDFLHHHALFDFLALVKTKAGIREKSSVMAWQWHFAVAANIPFKRACQQPRNLFVS